MSITRRRLLAGATFAARQFVRTASAAGPIALEVMASPYIKAVYERLIYEFQAVQTNVAVKLTIGPREDDQTAQQLLRTALIGAPLPDVVFLDNNLTRLLAERRLAVPLDTIIRADPHWNLGFSQGVTALGRVGGTIYGLAFGLSLPVLLFNSDLVRRAGGNPNTLPTTWTEIFELAHRINAFGLPFIGSITEYDGGAFTFLALLGSFGGRVTTPDEKHVAFGSGEGLKALQVLRGFGEAGQARADLSRDQARQAFGAGGIGVYATMSSTISRQEKAAAGRFDVMSVAFPLSSSNAWLPAAGPVAMMLTRDPAKQKAAFELMKFASHVRGQTILAAESGYAPVNEAALNESSTLRDIISRRGNANSYVARLNVATNWYAFPGKDSVRITDLIKNHLQQVVTLKEPADRALTAMANEVQRLLPA